jgi:hypothetical protein
MRRTNHIAPRLIAILVSLDVAYGCKQPYVSPYKNPVTGYLVVEGYISGNSVTQFSLTRTIPLPGDSTLPTVDGATVQVEGSDNSTYPLTDTGSGSYTSIDTLNLNPQLQYRLDIQTTDGEHYRSAFVQYKSTPPIDSVSWVENGDNSVNIYVNTHDPTNNTRYYQWSYVQTYQYTSADQSGYMYDGATIPPSIVNRPAVDQIYNCWITSHSTNVIIDNTTKLASDVVYLMPLVSLPPNSQQVSVLYSLLVKQYALTADGFNFLSLMQSNTESLGSVFDAQPTQLSSNITDLTNPGETVIGWISAGTEQSVRLWISRTQVFSNYNYKCPGDNFFVANTQMNINGLFSTFLYIPIYFGNAGGINGYESNFGDCLDCRYQGGTTVEPSFWPN